MKLYGIALAAVPRTDNENVLDVTCTRIAVSENSPKKFEILKDPAFPTTCNLENAQDSFGVFTRIVNAIDEVIALQKHSCDENNVDYRPVALRVGEDSRNPVDTSILTSFLFGIPLEYRRQLFGLNRKNEQCDLVKKARADFTAEHPAEMDEFLRTSAHLSELMGQCTLKWGSFSRNLDRGTEDTSGLDRRIAALRPLFERGDKTAHIELIQLAKKEGKKWGRIVNKNPNIFWHNVPPGYGESKEMQARYPHYSFYTWHNDFREAFYEGYGRTCKTAYTRVLKLPLDLRNPPFTDPCADMVRDQLQIVRGSRVPDAVDDEPHWREAIAYMTIKPYIEKIQKFMEAVKLFSASDQSPATAGEIRIIKIRNGPILGSSFVPHIVALPDARSTGSLVQSMRQYQDAVLKETFLNIRALKQKLKKEPEAVLKNELPGNSQSIADELAAKKNIIHSVLNTSSETESLPQMYGRDMKRYFRTGAPSVEQLEAACASDESFGDRRAAFDAVNQGDLKAWKKHALGLPLQVQVRLARIAYIMAENDSAAQHTAVDAVEAGVLAATTLEKQIAAVDTIFHKNVAIESAFAERLVAIILNNAPSLLQPQERFDSAKIALGCVTLNDADRQKAGRMGLDAVKAIRNSHKRIESMILLYRYVSSGPVSVRKQVFDSLVEEIHNLKFPDKRVASAIKVFNESSLTLCPANKKSMGKILLDYIAELDSPGNRISAATAIMRADAARTMKKHAGKIILDNLVQLPSREEQLAVACEVLNIKGATRILKASTNALVGNLTEQSAISTTRSHAAAFVDRHTTLVSDDSQVDRLRSRRESGNGPSSRTR